MSDRISLDEAQRLVREFTDDSDALMRNHEEAMECWACQEFLQKGITAYESLQHADEILRDAHAEGEFEFTANLREAVDRLYAAWLQPCAFANRWAEQIRAKGYEIDNLERFRSTCDEVEAALQEREWCKAARRARTLADADEPEW